MPKKRRHRSFSDYDEHLHLKRVKYLQNESRPSKLSKTVPSPEDVAHFQALQTSTDAMAVADVYEWLGDAIIGELVGRCLLSQFSQAPLSARVFRNLWLSVVANRNLAKVYDAMGYATIRRRRRMETSSKIVKMKQRADIVEALVGELVLKLHQSKINAEGLQAHLDAIVSTMLHTHFSDRKKAANTTNGMSSRSLNLFTCLHDEQLDETTGELIITEGKFSFQAFEQEEKLLSEYPDKTPRKTKGSHHSFVDIDENVIIQDEARGEKNSPAFYQVKMAMLQLNEQHILRTSKEIFDVFKIYGMSLLSERISLSLALPHVSVDFHHQANHSDVVTPARLTRERQLVLSVSNLAKCALLLGIGQPRGRDKSIEKGEEEEEEETIAARRLHHEQGLANTLRAFVGFHSAKTTTSAAANSFSNEVVDAVCMALYDAATSSRHENSSSSILRSLNSPKRISLVNMIRSVSEARKFMSSKLCDDLHQEGERPMSEAALEREQKHSLSLLRRYCESNHVEELVTIQHKKQLNQSHAASVSPVQRKKKRKRNNVTKGFAATAGCITRNLNRFLHRRFLFCLEEIVVLFAQQKTQACRAQIAAFEHDLVPCADSLRFRKWEVTTSTLTLVMRDSFFRMLLHDICQFHAIISSSKTTRDGTRVTQLRLPMHYTWANINTRVTTEQLARS